MCSYSVRVVVSKVLVFSNFIVVNLIVNNWCVLVLEISSFDSLINSMNGVNCVSVIRVVSIFESISGSFSGVSSWLVV